MSLGRRASQQLPLQRATTTHMLQRPGNRNEPCCLKIMGCKLHTQVPSQRPRCTQHSSCRRGLNRLVLHVSRCGSGYIIKQKWVDFSRDLNHKKGQMGIVIINFVKHQGAPCITFVARAKAFHTRSKEWRRGSKLRNQKREVFRTKNSSVPLLPRYNTEIE